MGGVNTMDGKPEDFLAHEGLHTYKIINKGGLTHISPSK
jgi:hypothetical protein